MYIFFSPTKIDLKNDCVTVGCNIFEARHGTGRCVWRCWEGKMMMFVELDTQVKLFGFVVGGFL